MTPTLRRAIGAAMTLAGLLALTALSNLPLRVHEEPDARLRVAFSARPERIETCRRPSAAEEADVPAHMRQSEVCEGTTARYRLDVRRDDSLLVTMLLRGGGLRHDRQLYVLRDVAVPRGRSTVDVRLTRLDSSATPDVRDDRDDGRDGDARRRRMADEVPPVMRYRETVELRPREVLLVTYDQSRRELLARRGSP